MNTKSITCAIAALSMSISGVAFAQNDKDVRADRAGRGSYDVVVPHDPRQDAGRGGHDRNDARGRPGQDRRGDNRHDDRGRPTYDQRADDRRYDRGRPDHGWRGNDRRSAPPIYRSYGRGAGPNHNFYRGGRLSPEYRNRQYVVDDWRGHHLTSPPRGYHWVQTGGDYVLVAIATGIIASILLSQ